MRPWVRNDHVTGSKQALAAAWVLVALLAEKDRLEAEVAAEDLSPEVAALMAWVDGQDESGDLP